MKVLVLGAGKMMEAILLGLKDQVDLSSWSIYSPSGASAETLAQKCGAKAVKDLTPFSKLDFVIIGCKPQQLHELKKIMPDHLKNELFVSVLAALSEKDQLQTLDAKKLIRVMPNLASKFKQGIGLISSESAKEELGKIQSLFDKIGIAKIVTENELEELTLLTGSSPAFYFEFALSLSKNFRSLNPLEREQLARVALIGAGHLLKDDPKDLSSHIDAVTSKGGVTIATLTSWRDLDLTNLLRKGVEAGKARAQEIRESLRRS
jgi:pyrroline-5-carboxylate reductase